MKKVFYLIALAIAAIAPQIASANETADAIVNMTYVDGSNADTAYGEIAAGETALAGYNKISSGTVALAYSSWNCNWITYLQVDASEINGTIVAATLSAEISGSTDSKRTTTWGAGYNTSTWSSDMTYNTADRSITTCGSTASSTQKSATTFESVTFDISDALRPLQKHHILQLICYLSIISDKIRLNFPFSVLVAPVRL